ncbi:MAG TPA: Glu/Leu/Phe/Val dehydrogenase dimerization domain-containing protein [Pyrinomonadaceae bacterium]|jgi:glutamate dehydrogenase/leucine dehydrogenase|nr:Glu/Leu/Phe/Val dehydrogenase dimerization domain-containing protein [Pyrinomonadaceae bacterium]
MSDGFRKYQSFFEKPPLLILEWHDGQSDAVGWLVINSLRNGAAGGGTRMRRGATREECIFLAKTMEIKFRVSGPPIGGAKSVIKVHFDPHDDKNKDKKRGVLSRWYESISPYLRHCYGTAGDLNVNGTKEVSPLISRLLNIEHPQEGILRGHFRCDEEEHQKRIAQLKEGVQVAAPVPGVNLGAGAKPPTVDDMSTGFGLARALRYFYQFSGDSLAGKSVLIEGFGQVGGAASYYLAREGVKVVGILSLANMKDGDSVKYRWAVSENGLDVNDLLARRDVNYLPPDCLSGLEADAEEFWNMSADIFIPAAASYTVDSEVLDRLNRGGVRVIACGANNPFYIDEDRPYEGMREMVTDALKVQKRADREFSIIPDFIANSGTARVFAYLMEANPKLDVESIYNDIDETIERRMRELLSGHNDSTGLLDRAYSLFVPETEEAGINNPAPGHPAGRVNPVS